MKSSLLAGLFAFGLLSPCRTFSSSRMIHRRKEQVSSQVVLWGKSQIRRMGPPPSTDEQVVVPSPHQQEEEEEAKMEIPSLSLDMLLSPASSCDVNQLGPTALAYIGDVVFELFVRTRKVWPSRKMSHLQNQVVALVRGELMS